VNAVPHLGFIVAAFAVTGAVVAAMIAAIWLDYRDLLAKLARLENRETERR
jgi:heme exporter protein CcmD